MTDLLSKFGMVDANPKQVLISVGTVLVKGSTSGEQSLQDAGALYREMVGGLMYLSTCTRPDISQSVSMLGRYSANPTQQHWQAGKGLLRYISANRSEGIRYGGHKKEMKLYVDADFAGDLDTRRSTTGYVVTINGGVGGGYKWAYHLV